jgi:glycosyltransferase involved in cell wall biosynthesis
LRVLILYTELAGYVLANINRFISLNPEAEVLLVHYPVNPEAPFDLSASNHIKFIDVKTSARGKIRDEVSKFNPEVVLCSGWGNKLYLHIVKSLPAHVKKVVCFDNQWTGKIRQRVLLLMSRFWLLKLFRYAWVPGQPQKEYALKLGFRDKNIFTGLYPADSLLYGETGKLKLSKRGVYPRLMISIARYIPQKDLPTLWNAFIRANTRSGNQWQLNCFGLGELYSSRKENEYIHHHGFKQPAEIREYILKAGVYVLPSTYEPWGVAVHEMALSALPLVLSDRVGAGSMFLSPGNGFVFKAGDENGLEEILYKIMCMDDETLWNMAEKSLEKGHQLTSDHWALTLKQIYNA